jgi:hypothetical protein
MDSCFFQGTHLAELVILERLLDLSPAIHDKRAVTHHWFVDRLTGHHQQPGFCAGRHLDSLTRSIQDRKISFAGGGPTAD